VSVAARAPRPPGLPDPKALLPSAAERRALGQQMKAQQAQAKAAMRAQLEAAKARPEVAEALRRAKHKKNRRRLMLLLAILALLLLRLDCSCEPVPAPPIEPVAKPPPEVKPVDKPKRKLRPKKPTFEGKVDKSDRGAMEVEPPPPPSWLPQFRLQVAARSPRLASCFEGNERPGALRWSALVHAKSGKVTESIVEPAFRGATLDDRQTKCLIDGLTAAPYNLAEPDDQAGPRRVSIIFEF
jgi:hypothetical protein